MSTLAQKISRSEENVTIVQSGNRRDIYDPELARAVKSAHRCWLKIRRLEAELTEHKTLIARHAESLCGGGSTVSFVCGAVRCTVSMRHEAVVPEENVAALRRLLGRRFRDLVRTKVQYTATARFMERAGDEELKLVRLKRLSPQFKWSPERRAVR